MLYGHPLPWSGATTLQVDGTDFWNFSSSNIGTLEGNPSTTAGVYRIVWNVEGVRLTQSLQLVDGATTDRLDTLSMKYDIENADSVEHAVGLRIFLDTWLAATDGAAFRAPGLGGIEYEREMFGQDVPLYWQSYDRLVNPTMHSQGTLGGGEATRPDRVIFGYWGTMAGSSWHYSIDESQRITADSAVALYYVPTVLQPGETRTVRSYYGLTGVGADLVWPLAASVYAPSRVEEIGGRYVPDPFIVTAYVANTVVGVTGPASGVYAEILLPPGLALNAGQAAHNDLGTLARDQEVQAYWAVRPLWRETSGELEFSVRIGSSGLGGSKTITRTIQLPELPAGVPDAAALYR